MPEFTTDTHLVCTSCLNAFMYLRKETATGYRFVCPKCGAARVIYKTAPARRQGRIGKWLNRKRS